MKIYLAAFLAIASLELFNVYIVRGSVGSQIMPLSSCVDLDPAQINIRRISHYETQHRPVKAVIFITRRGVKICVPHDLPWVQDAIQTLDQKNRRRANGRQNGTKITLRPKPATS
ncbi:lymphotactin-like [Tiliqua scincoides]|uniref:lymphotactin-like n=1 Tax=Tiliqua scincoides TaxID=71010 RepID=UPI0034617E43